MKKDAIQVMAGIVMETRTARDQAEAEVARLTAALSRQTEHMAPAMSALQEKASELIQSKPEACVACDAAGTCVGDYGAVGLEVGCDTCCKHEVCEPLVTRSQKLANLASAFGQLAGCVQELLPDHANAGIEFEEMAEACIRAYQGPATPRRVFTYPNQA